MISTSDEHVLNSLPAYALGSLDAAEARPVEEHLASCWICRSELNTFQTVAERLSLAAPVVIPAPDLKVRLMQRVQTARSERGAPVPPPKRPWLERLLPAWGLASLLLIAGLAAFSLSLWGRLNRLEVNTAPGGMRAVPLSASAVGSAATGFVLISPDGDAGALIVDGLPPLGESQEYQVWLIRDGKRISGAVFSTDERNYGGTRIRAPRSLLEYSAVDITIEPEGGSPQPTGDQVLAGPLFNP
jgi:anti-sigma-K factor RskA